MRRPTARSRVPAIAVHVLAALGVASCTGGWTSAWLRRQEPQPLRLPAALTAVPALMQERRSCALAFATGTPADSKLPPSALTSFARSSGWRRQPRSRVGWSNKVPKADRLASLEAHLQEILRHLAKSSAFRALPGSELCLEIERRVEALYPDEDEERVSLLCHKRIRKLGNCLRSGWESELMAGADAERPFSDMQGLLHRMGTLGHGKQRSYQHIRQGERIGSASLPRSDLEKPDSEDAAVVRKWERMLTTQKEYGQAVLAQSKTGWHKESVASVVEVLRKASAARILDIGSSFNPLREEFAHVAAVDQVPTHDSVYVADFFEVELVPASDIDSSSSGGNSSSRSLRNTSHSGGLHSIGVRTDPANARRCVAVAEDYYDGVLLSMVLRSLNAPQARREMVAKAAKTLRAGGLLIIVERLALGSLLRYRGPADSTDPFWRSVGLLRRGAKRCTRNVLVHTFERCAASGDAEMGCSRNAGGV